MRTSVGLELWEHTDEKDRKNRKRQWHRGRWRKKTSRQRCVSQISGCTDWSRTLPILNPPLSKTQPTPLPCWALVLIRGMSVTLHCSHTLGLEENIALLHSPSRTHKRTNTHSHTTPLQSTHTNLRTTTQHDICSDFTLLHKKIIPTLQTESSNAGKYPATHVQTEKQLCARSVDMLMYMHAFALHIFISTMLEMVLRKWAYRLTILSHS